MLELGTDDVHAGKQAFFKNRLGINPLIDCLLNEFFNILGLAFLQECRDVIQNSH